MWHWHLVVLLLRSRFECGQVVAVMERLRRVEEVKRDRHSETLAVAFRNS